MRVLILYDYPPSPGGLSTQGDLLYKGLLAVGVDAHAAHWQSEQEKEWYYHWFKPDVVVGVGYWGHTPSIVLHPQKFRMQAVPWLVADGYIANYQDVLNKLPLILVTSNWVKEMYIRDGISGDRIEVLPVGCDTDSFVPHPIDDPKILAVREGLGIAPNELMILTIGGDAASKGSNEVMQALAMIDKKVPSWKYICKVWPQPRTTSQNLSDRDLAEALGIEKKVSYATNTISRDFMGIYRKLTGDFDFLDEAITKALSWMAHQCPTDQVMVAQQPTTDWRDEQWVLGYGLYVNTLYHTGLQLLGQHTRAAWLAEAINGHFIVPDQPYYALWVYKLYHNYGFDLLGNSLAIITGIASPEKAKAMISWIEDSCEAMMVDGLLVVDLPPNFFPFIYPDDRDWHQRYAHHNLPGDYHNGGIWPFICGLYIAALVTVNEFDRAEKKLLSLTNMVKRAANANLEYGFNEWMKSQTGFPSGQDWQTWSAALYLYAAKCVTTRKATLLVNPLIDLK